MIIVTGANGNLGAQTVRSLLERLPADQVGVSVRDPDRAEHLAERGVRVRRGDFSEPASLESAFANASQVLIISVDAIGDDGVEQNKAAIDAAYRAGVERVVYTSHQAANAESPFPPARDHAAVEAYLDKGGRPFTALRNGFYATSLHHRVGNAAHSGELPAPADGPVSWTSPTDLAEAAAAILAGEAVFDGPTPPLTAAEALDLHDIAELLSRLCGRSVRRVVVADDEWIARSVDRGMPEHLARMFLGTFEAARNGEFAVTDPTLATLIGHQPESVRAFLTADLAA